MITQPYLWEIHEGESPIFATAIHNGHTLLEKMAENIHVNSGERLREEDPFTGHLTHVSDNRIVVHLSRFQTDLNRSIEKSIYLNPENSWGLKVFNEDLPRSTLIHSYQIHKQFYEEVEAALKRAQKKFGYFVVLDLHSYNHRRNGRQELPESTRQNPEINIGTISIDRQRWGWLVERFINELRFFNYFGKSLDVRENIKFQGRGFFSTWINNNFSKSACSIAIEYKKFYMDEWTGGLNLKVIHKLKEALESTIPGLLKELKKIK